MLFEIINETNLAAFYLKYDNNFHAKVFLFSFFQTNIIEITKLIIG